MRECNGGEQRSQAGYLFQSLVVDLPVGHREGQEGVKGIAAIPGIFLFVQKVIHIFSGIGGKESRDKYILGIF
ncbi:hypothetical protein D9M70_644240 [compost metagenome]